LVNYLFVDPYLSGQKLFAPAPLGAIEIKIIENQPV
jgi:hypothetical protein